MLAGDHFADAYLIAYVDGVHGQIEQQILLLSGVGDAAVHVSLDFILCTYLLPKAELVQSGAPELIGA